MLKPLRHMAFCCLHILKIKKSSETVPKPDSGTFTMMKRFKAPGRKGKTERKEKSG